MSNGIQSKQLKGFSLFEVIVTMGILLLIAIFVFPVTIQKAQETKLEGHASQLTTDIYYQQQRAFLKEIPSGIALQGDGYTIFDGDSLSTATETQERVFPANISVNYISLSTGSEILFESGNFKPSVHGSLVITDGFSSVRVYINSEGLIGYETL